MERTKQRTKIKESTGERIFTGVIYAILILFCAIIVFPLLHIVSGSFSDPMALLRGEVSFWPKGFTFSMYEKVFKDASIWQGYGNTIVYTVLGTCISVVLTAFAAYPLSRKDFYGRNLFMGVFVFTMFFTGGMIPTFLIVQRLHLLNTMWALILPTAVSTYNLILMRTVFESTIPFELVESASLDGCNDLVIFFSIVLPLSTAIIAVMALFFAVTHWNGYFTAMIYVRDKDWQPLQIVMREILMRSEFNAQMLQQGGDTGVLAAQEQRIAEQIKYALIVVASVPVMCIYPFVQKHFVKGVTVGAVKG